MYNQEIMFDLVFEATDGNRYHGNKFTKDVRTTPSTTSTMCNIIFVRLG